MKWPSGRNLQGASGVGLFHMLARLRLISRHSSILASSIYPLSAAAMSSFTLPSTDPAVTVKLTTDLSKDQLLSFPAFKTWLNTLQHSLSLQSQASHPFHAAPYVLRHIDIQAADFFGGGRLGFLKFKADVSNEEGERLPGSIFLRGGSVCMMVRTPRS